MKAPHSLTLEADVRRGARPNDPQLLYAYLDLCDEMHDWRVYLHTHRVLLAVIGDSNVPRHWRWLCLDHAYRPVAGMYRLVRTDQDREVLRRCNHELSMSSHLHLAP